MADARSRPTAMTVARPRPMPEVLAAVAFLTRVPLPRRAASPTTTGAAAFGLVGAAIGLAAVVPILLIGPGHATLGALGAIAVVAVLSGGLHLDGLADTFDALAAPTGAAEVARTDPRAGAAGVIAIVLALGIEVACLAELIGRGSLGAAAVLVGGAAVSRAAAPVWAVLVGRRRRPPRGLGAWFAESTTGSGATIATVTALIVVVGIAAAGAVRIGITALVGAAIGSVAAGLAIRARGQLDGDGYGAIVELTFASVLVGAAVLG